MHLIQLDENNVINLALLRHASVEAGPEGLRLRLFFEGDEHGPVPSVLVQGEFVKSVWGTLQILCKKPIEPAPEPPQVGPLVKDLMAAVKKVLIAHKQSDDVFALLEAIDSLRKPWAKLQQSLLPPPSDKGKGAPKENA